jgi:hypothetical protein
MSSSGSSFSSAQGSILDVYVEYSGGLYSFYNNSTREFLCNGRSLDEVSDQFDIQNPGVTIHIADAHPDIIEELRKIVVDKFGEGAVK